MSNRPVEEEGGKVLLDREALHDLIAEHLGGTYHCTRVWAAWQVGTMSQDDFSRVDESDTPGEIADAIMAHFAPGAAAATPEDWKARALAAEAALQPFARIAIDCAAEIVPNGYANPEDWRADVRRARAAQAQGGNHG